MSVPGISVSTVRQPEAEFCLHENGGTHRSSRVIEPQFCRVKHIAGQTWWRMLEIPALGGGAKRVMNLRPGYEWMAGRKEEGERKTF